DPELDAYRGSGRIEALRVHPPAAAILQVARPGNHEVAGGVARHGRLLLVVGGGAVDPEFGPLRRAVGVKALGEDAGTAAVRRRPDREEVAGGVGRGRPGV